jgi:prophage DNA circulation protein
MQATCVPDVSEKTRGDLSRALASVRSGEIAALVGARIDEPRLDEESRKRMEQIMSLAAGMARQLTEMTDVRARLKPGPNPTTAFQRRGWRIQHPIQSAADLDRAIADTQGILAKMCMDGLTGVNATLLDETRGLMRLIK